MIGTGSALGQTVPNKLNILWASMGLAIAAAAGCVPCDPNATMHGLAPRPQYDRQIDTCITMKSCVELCREVFKLDGTVDIRSCKIDNVDAANAHVVVSYYDNTCSSDNSADIGVDDSGYYDGGDDGTYDSSDDGSNEGSSDDGSTDDGSSDGSTDDGGDSGGDGGGDGGGDDGGDRHAPTHTFVQSMASQNARK